MKHYGGSKLEAEELNRLAKVPPRTTTSLSKPVGMPKNEKKTGSGRKSEDKQESQERAEVNKKVKEGRGERTNLKENETEKEERDRTSKLTAKNSRVERLK